MSIHVKLMQIQSQLKVPKSQYNKFGNYNYRSCEDILEAVKPLLAETKTTLTISDEINQIGDRYYIRAVAVLTDIESGDTVSVSALAREEDSKKGMDASQLTGATSSYARKYALNGLFCIDDTKDSDATNKHGKDESDNDQHKNKQPINRQTISYFDLCKQKGLNDIERQQLLKRVYGEKNRYTPQELSNLAERIKDTPVEQLRAAINSEPAAGSEF